MNHQNVEKLTSLLKEIRTTEISDDIVRRFEVYEEIRGYSSAEISSASISVLDSTDDPQLKLYVLELLVEFMPEVTVSYLLDILGHDDAALRRWGCIILAKTASREAVPTIVKILKNDFSTDVRVTAAYALGRLGDLQVIPILEWVKINDFSSDFEGTRVNDEATRAINTILARFPDPKVN